MSCSRETKDVSSKSWPMLGQMTGGRTREHHLDFKPIDTSKVRDALRAAETVYQLAMQQIPQEVEVPQAVLIYPEGEGDAVTITEKDMEELQPGKFLGNHIVDFYIKYLERGLSPEHRDRFYFFNSFFFTKLLQSTAPTRIDPFKLDYEQIRKWTEEVNLFEKDYVFIPIVERYHWSLVIICNLSSLTCAFDEMTRFPCIVHLDPMEGQHKSFEGLIRSYVLEAWMDRFEPSIHKDQLRALYQMKYVQAEVPQQDNSHDCGLYILHYVETFLVESTSSNFSFASSERGPHFTSLHFVMEVLSKRKYIHDLILELQGIFQEHIQERKEIEYLLQELKQTSQKLQAHLEEKGNFKAYNKDLLIASPFVCNEGCEINHASILEDSVDVHQHQPSGISRGSIEPLNGPQITPLMEYETKCEHLSLQQHDVEFEVEMASTSNFKSSFFEVKHASLHKDKIQVQHQESSVLSWLDGCKLQNVNSQGVTESFSGNSISCIKDLLIDSPTICNEGYDINHASIHEDSMNVHQHQPSVISKGSIEPLNSPQSGPMGYETRCEHLSLQQHDVELEVETTSSNNCNNSIFEIKHALIHEDAIHVQHQQSSKISRLDYELLDGLEYGHVDKYELLEHEEVPCMDLSKAKSEKIREGRI